MTDAQYLQALATIEKIHAEIDAITTSQHNPGAAYVMLANLFLLLSAAAEEEITSPSSDLSRLIAERPRIEMVLSKKIVDAINGQDN
jgi:hypothetical protein